MYNKNGGGDAFRRFNSCNMAWWHSYKHACLKIWEAFACSLLAPWWHFLYPGAQFHKKPSSFPSVVYHLLVLSKTWPHIKGKVQELRADVEIRGARKQLLDNVVFLFEFAIPTVPHHLFSGGT
jgi:hypothetical protein